MPTYRNKQIIIEAEQWSPGTQIAGVTVDPTGNHAYIGNPHTGLVPVAPGDFIITHNTGAQERMPADLFLTRWAPVSVQVHTGGSDETASGTAGDGGQPDNPNAGAVGSDPGHPKQTRGNTSTTIHVPKVQKPAGRPVGHLPERAAKPVNPGYPAKPRSKSKKRGKK